jgi:predicted methyltransferase
VIVYAVLSCREAGAILDARGEKSVRTSLDCGISVVEIGLGPEGIVLPGDGLVPWREVERVSNDCGVCYRVDDGRTVPIRTYSEVTNRVIALMPTSGAPTITLSGIAMHRIQGTDPWADTRSKIRAIGRVRGRGLDVCTGLGYTAIQASKWADSIVTIELDPAVLEIAGMNPWSRGLFESEKIDPVIGDAVDVVAEVPSEWFDFVIHDPPLFGLAGYLYSLEFYRELRRVLRRGGRLFHYVGNPESKMSGNVTRGVVRRLQEAGFRVVKKPKAFGVLALKQ